MREDGERAYCAVCGGEVYAFERVWRDGSDIFHEDCLRLWAEENLEFFECATDIFEGREAV